MMKEDKPKEAECLTIFLGEKGTQPTGTAYIEVLHEVINFLISLLNNDVIN